MGELLRKDVLNIGLGRTGSIIANEMTDEGLVVVAIERGPPRDAASDFPPNCDQIELRCRIRHELLPRSDQTTFTFRDKMSQAAQSIRSWASPPSTNPAITAAAAIDRDVCLRCRAIGGEGVSDLLPALASHASFVRTPSVAHPHYSSARAAWRALASPPRRDADLRWRLANEQLAAVAAYIRNSSGSSRRRFRPTRLAKHARRLHGGATDW